MFLVFLAMPTFAADTATLRRGLESPEGWGDIERKAIDGVGEVLVRHKAVAGQECLEGSVTAALSPDALLAAAVDVPGQPRWSTWELPAAVKLSDGITAFDYYQVLDNPPPIADRVWFLRGTVLRRGDARVFTWEQIDGAARYPDAWADVAARFPGVVATRVNVGDWTFTPTPAGTEVRYRICTDAGGSVPRWVGEIAARNTLPTNVADLVREVKRRAGR